MNRLSIFGIIFAVVGIVMTFVGIFAVKSIVVATLGGALVGSALVCGYRVWQMR